MKRDDIERLLPDIFQRTLGPGRPLFVLLEVMEALHAPSELVLAELDRFFDPYRTPDRFVPFLARWVDLEWLVAPDDPAAAPAAKPFPSGTGRLRELVAAAVFFSRWRGTATGLLAFLETATGWPGFTIDEHVAGPDGQLRPFHLRVVGPREAAAYRLLVEQIIAAQKPAYATYEVEFVSMEQPA